MLDTHKMLSVTDGCPAFYLLGDHSDLGLGGIVLEGESDMGKSYFVAQVVREYQVAHPDAVVIVIPSTASYLEKEQRVREAMATGALVIADEFNTSEWPNVLLNHFLMGEDEKGKALSKTGLLLATGNPLHYSGRTEDLAVRRRVIKLSLNWPAWNPSAVTRVTKGFVEPDKKEKADTSTPTDKKPFDSRRH